MPSNKPRLMTYTTKETEMKLKHIADKQSRSVSKQLDYIVKNYIENYEQEHGTIELPEQYKD